mmetsp:Transcript_14655/g.21358  ORF Transcript_14655/g.21358 Transcript_14655/m.21358 type:complete len:338 (+) Transcript_14655:530-1543(+)
MGESDSPLYINNESGYLMIKDEEYFAKKSQHSSDNSLVVKFQSLQGVPGSWFYKKYTKTHLNHLRTVHTVGYLLELLGYSVGEIIGLFHEENKKNTPFNLDSTFEDCMWGLVVFLGLFLVPVVFKTNPYSISLIADKIQFYQVPVYALFSIYLTTRRYFGLDTYFLVFNSICLFVNSGFVFYIYSRVKYKDDGRYYVGWLEYVGAHVQFSMLAAWNLVEFCSCVIVLIVELSKHHQDSKFLGWDNENWTLLLMSLAFVLGVIMLSSFKDVFFSFVLTYTFFAIYYQQTKSSRDNDSSNVEVTSLVFGGLMTGFVVLTSAVYPNLICYSVRKSKKLTN